MGYCDGDCTYLERDKRHTCARYNIRLGYIKQSGRSMSFTAHEQCRLCDQDQWIQVLEAKLKCQFVNKECIDKDCKRCPHGGFAIAAK